MRLWTRRNAVLAAVAAGLAGVVGWRWFATPKQRMLARLTEAFGAPVGQSDAALEFVDALVVRVGEDGLDGLSHDALVNVFLRATNAVRALETGDDPVFVGLDDPEAAPCANPLSSGWL